MSKALKLVPGRKHLKKPPQGEVSGGKRVAWFERLHTCGAITKGNVGEIKKCAGGAANRALNDNRLTVGCGKLFIA